MVTVRPYIAVTDFPMLSSWWEAQNEPGPTADMVPCDSTWVAELDGLPGLSVSLILTNVSEYCLVDNFIGNPSMKGSARSAATLILLQYIEDYARDRGYKKLFCLGYRPKVIARYEEIGFGRTLDGVSTFVKTL